MAGPFKGTINVDIRDSEPDWTPFEPPVAPYGAPNVLYVVLDDVGFSAMSCYGGPIETPNIDRIADSGLRYTQWHTTALCSPTRSCLLTGRNHTRNSMACITEAAIGFPNGSGTVPPENGMIPEMLVERGWNTYIVGKWHLCPEAEMNLPPINPLGTAESHTNPAKPMNEVDITRPWDTLSADEKRLFCRMAEVYAGFLAHADHQIGRLLDYLEETGQRENTLIIVVSDNGASGEGGPNGSVDVSGKPYIDLEHEAVAMMSRE